MEPGAAALLEAIGWAGEAAFAVSGALLAARHRLDLIGFLFMANITGVGGGTVRDLLLDVPVFWVHEPEHVLICSLAAVLTWLLASHLARAARALLWADAVGIALFAVLGAQKALVAGAPAVVAVVMGIFTACLGGIIRDTLLKDLPVIMSREIYVTATLAGASAYVALASQRGAGDVLALGCGIAVAFALRALAISRGLELPSHAGLGAGRD